MSKIFRIVETGDQAMMYRIDQLHTVLFVIHYWEKGSSDLSPCYLWSDLDKAVGYIKDMFPDATIYLKLPEYIKSSSSDKTSTQSKTDTKSNEYYEKEYNVKVVSGSPCGSCAYHYDGVEDIYPHIPGKDRPHPRICINNKRCLEDKSKCYVKDLL